MGFLQPWFLIALPLVMIPIVIHLVNQWRYQTKPWAAMMFLLRAKTLDRGFDRMRHWIILAMRVAAVLGLILAASRPIASGVFGWLGGGEIDTVMVLMDCSPSMLATGAQNAGPQNEASKHQTAIRQLTKSLEFFSASKWVLIDSNTLDATQFSSSKSLLESARLRVSDAACDWPAMMETALTYLDRERPPQTQVWMVSDLQATNFRAESPRWADIRKRLKDAKTTVRFTSIEYPDFPASNHAVRVVDARLTSRETETNLAEQTSSDLLLSILVQDTSPDAGANASSQLIPVTIAWEGNETQISVEMVAGRGEVKDLRIGSITKSSRNAATDTKSDNSKRSWGQVRLPRDGNLADNEDFFAVDAPSAAKTLIVAEQIENVLPVMIAAESPVDSTTLAKVNVVTPSRFDVRQLDDVAFLVWQADLPDAKSLDSIQTFSQKGGSTWLFPPEQIVAPNLVAPNLSVEPSREDSADTAASQKPLSEFAWGEWVTLVDPISPTRWLSDTGILRATQSGASLEVGELKVSKLATMVQKNQPSQEEAWKLKSIAGFVDGKALIGALPTLPGEVIVWGTLPAERYSNIGYSSAVVLYVAVQRAIESGLKNLKSIVSRDARAGTMKTEPMALATGVDFATVGLRLPPPDQWSPLLTTDRFLSTQIENHAGVFQAGSKLVSLHRPELEDTHGILESKDWNRLFEGVPIKRLSEQTGTRDDLQSESWRAFMVLLVVALIVEAAMSLPKKLK